MDPILGLVVLRLALAAPLTLDDALAMAAQRNADLEVARADEQLAEVNRRASYTGVLPRLDLTGSFGHQFEGAQQQVNVVTNPAPPPEFVRIPVTFPANDYGAHQLSLTLTWTIFDGLSSWNAIHSARLLASSAKRQYDESALQLSFEVTRRFYEVVKQQRALDVRRETMALSEDLVKRSDALFSAGRGTKADTYLARVNLANDRLAVETQVALLGRARADLAAALGLSSSADLEVIPPATVTGPGAPSRQDVPDVQTLLTTARKKRPLIDARKLATDAADVDIARARGGYWPSVGLQASYQRASPDLGGTSGVFGDPTKNYVALVQATVSWNLFAGGETRTGVQRAEVQARRAQALVQQGQQQVTAEVTAAHDQLAALEESIPIAQQLLQAAENGVRFAREQLEARLATQLEVRDAALKLTQARLTWVSTVVDLMVARADLARAVGGAP